MEHHHILRNDDEKKTTQFTQKVYVMKSPFKITDQSRFLGKHPILKHDEC